MSSTLLVIGTVNLALGLLLSIVSAYLSGKGASRKIESAAGQTVVLCGLLSLIGALVAYLL